MKVLEKDGNEWDYGNKAMFMCWEVLYDHGCYENLKQECYRWYAKEHNGTMYTCAPSLEDCYYIIYNEWSK